MRSARDRYIQKKRIKKKKDIKAGTAQRQSDESVRIITKVIKKPSSQLKYKRL